MFLICDIESDYFHAPEVAAMYRYFGASYGICLQYLLTNWVEYGYFDDDIVYEQLADNMQQGITPFINASSWDEDDPTDYHGHFDVLYQVLETLIAELRPHINEAGKRIRLTSQTSFTLVSHGETVLRIWIEQHPGDPINADYTNADCRSSV